MLVVLEMVLVGAVDVFVGLALGLFCLAQGIVPGPDSLGAFGLGPPGAGVFPVDGLLVGDVLLDLDGDDHLVLDLVHGVHEEDVLEHHLELVLGGEIAEGVVEFGPVVPDGSGVDALHEGEELVARPDHVRVEVLLGVVLDLDVHLLAEVEYLHEDCWLDLFDLALVHVLVLAHHVVQFPEGPAEEAEVLAPELVAGATSC